MSDQPNKFYLEAEQSYGVDNIVLSVGPRGRQYCGDVVDCQRAEEQETQQVAPDIHSLIGQHKNTAKEKKQGQSALMLTHYNTENICIQSYIKSTHFPPSQAEFGGQMGPVAVCDVGVFFEKQGDLLIGVQSYPLGDQHRPVLVAAQLHVLGSLQQLLGHLQQHVDHSSYGG